MSYQNAVKYLESFINYENIPSWRYKESIGLKRIQSFLQTIGNPQDSLRCIHIAGSKGKGSTCAFIAYILREAGYTTGLYTSPHLSDFRERIRILKPIGRCQVQNDFEGMITKNSLEKFVARLKPAIKRFNADSPYGALSFFEVYTALAFSYFKKKRVDFLVVETGLGGRLDATNVVRPLVCAITPISYEHTDKLGKTLSAIAKEKSGIIKPGPFGPLNSSPGIVVSAPQEKEAMAEISLRARECAVTLLKANRQKLLPGHVYACKRRIYFKVPLIGAHQEVNASVAIGVIMALRRQGVKISDGSIRQGVRRTIWPGRCEVVAREPLIVLDGAQNIASAQVLKKAIRGNFKYKNLILILGISKDKDIKGICSVLKSLADTVILTMANTPRATDPGVLAGYFRGKKIIITSAVKEAAALAMTQACRKDLVLVTGSLFVVAEARDVFSGKGFMTGGSD
jgi:dihydrofolate synthase/folylpolyglutamate synthase